MVRKRQKAIEVFRTVRVRPTALTLDIASDTASLTLDMELSKNPL